MTSHQFVDAVIVFCIAALIVFIEAIGILFSVGNLIKSKKELLMAKTKKELKLMIGEMKGISRLNKSDLVELLLVDN